ncbi:MAG: sugar phosphate isomerase/epimerase family protein [Hyphomicrobiales bacterium]
MKLAFSTLGCPQWPFADILKYGHEYGFDGVAFRGVKGELDLAKVPEFAPAERRRSRERMRRAGLEPSMLLTSTRLMLVKPAEIEESLNSARAHIDLAAELGAPAVRVFGGQLPVGLSRSAAVRRAAERLRQLGDHAARKGVLVLLETHDDFTDPIMVRQVMEAALHPAVGVLWDIHHPFRILAQPTEQAWRELGPWVKACDLKDSVSDDTARLGYRYVRIGEGELPLDATLRLLHDVQYDGWLTFEWEKMWHPDIADPHDSFPHFTRTIRERLARFDSSVAE